MAGSLVRLSPPSAAARLLCLPGAGGRGDYFRRWVPDLAGILELWTTVSPERSSGADRSSETDLDLVVNAIAAEALDLMDRPLAVLGHSMGAMLGIEVIRAVERRATPLRALIVCGCAAPANWTLQAVMGERTDDELVALMQSWGGTPPELLQDRDFLHLALPRLRADLRLCLQYRNQPGRIRTPIVAFAGSSDVTAPALEVGEWSACSTDWRGLHILPGGHFFIHSAQRALIDAIIATRLLDAGGRAHQPVLG
jgi:surfactin synthase thioesterase subunit